MIAAKPQMLSLRDGELVLYQRRVVVLSQFTGCPYHDKRSLSDSQNSCKVIFKSKNTNFTI